MDIHEMYLRGGISMRKFWSSGSNGIGAATARKFVAEGAYVYIANINKEGGVKVCQELDGNASFVKCDVAIETHVKGVIDRAIEEKGCLDIMMNNAGMLHAHGNSITQVSVETWERVMVVNVTGAMVGMKHATRVMIPCNSSSILFNCSVLGLMKTDNASHGYMASKNALLEFDEEWCSGVGKGRNMCECCVILWDCDKDD
ncbi:secoisolariciresinol dehydrogenase-like [Cryptomeria japonica]|uniref:secoisolariciresinol dehydrogenase-like n=1 Tax=Cryptomeria japonica TaxID=3369 RepID=UPI0027D9F38F|nr:secoisolariciresinol dehydrogenase-like [Cryptomeria japonica]